MAMMVPDEVRGLFLVLTGEEWPDANEDHLRLLADAWETAGNRLGQEFGPRLQQAVATVGQNFQGQAAEMFRGRMAPFVDGSNSYIETSAQQFVELAKFLRGLALEVEYVKLVSILTLVSLLLEMIWAYKMAVWTAGASMSWIAVRIAIVRTFIDQLLKRLWMKVAYMVAMAGLMGVVFQVVIDVLAQSIQFAMGTRQQWDTKFTSTAAQIGALGGAVSLVLGPLGGVIGGLVNKGLTTAITRKEIRDTLVAALQEVGLESAVEVLTEGLYTLITEGKFELNWAAAVSGAVSGGASVVGTAGGNWKATGSPWNPQRPDPHATGPAPDPGTTGDKPGDTGSSDDKTGSPAPPPYSPPPPPYSPQPAAQPPAQPAPVPGQPAPGQPAPGQPAPVPGQPNPQPGQPAPGEAVPVPGQPVPGQPNPQPAPGEPVPGQPAPVPGQPTPGQPTPVPGQPAPGQPNPQPGEPLPGRPAPGQPAPGQPSPQPGQPLPGQPAPVPGEPVPGQPTPGQPSPQPGQPIPGEPQPGQPLPGQPAPGQPVPAPGEPVPGQPSPQPGQPQPGQPQPGQPQPGQPQPGQPVPAPGQTVPGQPVPAPGQPVPGEPAPGQPVPQPGQPAPGQPVPAPGEPTPEQPAPGQPLPGQQQPAPGQPTAGEPLPGQQGAVQPGQQPLPGQQESGQQQSGRPATEHGTPQPLPGQPGASSQVTTDVTDTNAQQHGGRESTVETRVETVDSTSDGSRSDVEQQGAKDAKDGESTSTQRPTPAGLTAPGLSLDGRPSGSRRGGPATSATSRTTTDAEVTTDAEAGHADTQDGAKDATTSTVAAPVQPARPATATAAATPGATSTSTPKPAAKPATPTVRPAGKRKRAADTADVDAGSRDGRPATPAADRPRILAPAAPKRPRRGRAVHDLRAVLGPRDADGTPAPVVTDADTTALATAVGVDGEGRPRRFADLTTWLALVNPSGSLVNCVDAALAFHATWHGRPTVAAALATPERAGAARAHEVTDHASDYVGEGAPALAEVVDRVRRGGHGSDALAFVFLPRGGAGHVWNIVNQHGMLHAVDVQSGRSVVVDGATLPTVGAVWTVPLDADGAFITGATADPATATLTGQGLADAGTGRAALTLGGDGHDAGVGSSTAHADPHDNGQHDGNEHDGDQHDDADSEADDSDSADDGDADLSEGSDSDAEADDTDGSDTDAQTGAEVFADELTAALSDLAAADTAVSAATVDREATRQLATTIRDIATQTAAAVARAEGPVPLARQHATAAATEATTARAEATRLAGELDTARGDRDELVRQQADHVADAADDAADAASLRADAAEARRGVAGLAADDTARTTAEAEALRLEGDADALDLAAQGHRDAATALDGPIAEAKRVVGEARTAARAAAVTANAVEHTAQRVADAARAVTDAATNARAAHAAARRSHGVAAQADTDAGTALQAATDARDRARRAFDGHGATPGVRALADAAATAADTAEAARRDADDARAAAQRQSRRVARLEARRDALAGRHGRASRTPVPSDPATAARRATAIAELRAAARRAGAAAGRARAELRTRQDLATALHDAAADAEQAASDAYDDVTARFDTIARESAAASTPVADTAREYRAAAAERTTATTALATAKAAAATGDAASTTTLTSLVDGPLSSFVTIDGDVPTAQLRAQLRAAARAQVPTATPAQLTALDRAVDALFARGGPLSQRELHARWQDLANDPGDGRARRGVEVSVPHPDRRTGPITFRVDARLSADTSDREHQLTAPPAATKEVRRVETSKGITDTTSTSAPARIPLFVFVLPIAEAVVAGAAAGLALIRPIAYVGGTTKRSHTASTSTSTRPGETSGARRQRVGSVTFSIEPVPGERGPRSALGVRGKAHTVLAPAVTEATSAATLAVPPVTAIAGATARPLTDAHRDRMRIDRAGPTRAFESRIVTALHGAPPATGPAPTLTPAQRRDLARLMADPALTRLADPAPGAAAPAVTGSIDGTAVTLTSTGAATITLFGHHGGVDGPGAELRTAHGASTGTSRGSDAVLGGGLTAGYDVPKHYLHAGVTSELSSGHTGGASRSTEHAIERLATRDRIFYVVERPMTAQFHGGATANGSTKALVALTPAEAAALGLDLPAHLPPPATAATTPTSRYRFGRDDVLAVPGAQGIVDHVADPATNPLAIDATGRALLAAKFADDVSAATSLFDAAHGGDSVTWDMPKKWWQHLTTLGLTRQFELSWHAEFRHPGANVATTVGRSGHTDQIATGQRRTGEVTRGWRTGPVVENRLAQQEPTGQAHHGHRSTALPDVGVSYQQTKKYANESGPLGRTSLAITSEGPRHSFDADVHLVFTLREVVRPNALRNTLFRPSAASRSTGPSTADVEAAMARQTGPAPVNAMAPRLLEFTQPGAASMSADAAKLDWATSRPAPAAGDLSVGVTPHRAVAPSQRLDMASFGDFIGLEDVRVTSTLTDALDLATAKSTALRPPAPAPATTAPLPRGTRTSRPYARLWTSRGTVTYTDAAGNSVDAKLSRLSQPGTQAGDQVKAFFSEVGARSVALLGLDGEPAHVDGLTESGATTDLSSAVVVTATHHNPRVVSVKPHSTLVSRHDHETTLRSTRGKERAINLGVLVDWLVGTGSKDAPRLRVPIGHSWRWGTRRIDEAAPGSLEITTYEGPTALVALDLLYTFDSSLVVRNRVLGRWGTSTADPLRVHADVAEGKLVEVPARVAADMFRAVGRPVPPEVTAVIRENPLTGAQTRPVAPGLGNQTLLGDDPAPAPAPPAGTAPAAAPATTPRYRVFGPSSIVRSSLAGANPLGDLANRVDALVDDPEWRDATIDAVTQVLATRRGLGQLRDAFAGGQRVQVLNNDPLKQDVLEVTIREAAPPAGHVRPPAAAQPSAKLTPKSLSVFAYTMATHAVEKFTGRTFRAGLVGQHAHLDERKSNPDGGGTTVFFGGARADQTLAERDTSTLQRGSILTKPLTWITMSDIERTSHDVHYELHVRRITSPMPVADAATLTTRRGIVTDGGIAHADGTVEVVSPAATSAPRPTRPAVEPTFHAAPLRRPGIVPAGTVALDPAEMFQPESLGRQTQAAIRDAVRALASRKPLPLAPAAAPGSRRIARATITAAAAHDRGLLQPGSHSEDVVFHLTTGTSLQHGMPEMLTGDDYAVSDVASKRVTHDDLADLRITAHLRGASLSAALTPDTDAAGRFWTDDITYGRETENVDLAGHSDSRADRAKARAGQANVVGVGSHPKGDGLDGAPQTVGVGEASTGAGPASGRSTGEAIHTVRNEGATGRSYLFRAAVDFHITSDTRSTNAVADTGHKVAKDVVGPAGVDVRTTDDVRIRFWERSALRLGLITLDTALTAAGVATPANHERVATAAGTYFGSTATPRPPLTGIAASTAVDDRRGRTIHVGPGVARRTFEQWLATVPAELRPARVVVAGDAWAVTPALLATPAGVASTTAPTGNPANAVDATLDTSDDDAPDPRGGRDADAGVGSSRDGARGGRHGRGRDTDAGEGSSRGGRRPRRPRGHADVSGAFDGLFGSSTTASTTDGVTTDGVITADGTTAAVTDGGSRGTKRSRGVAGLDGTPVTADGASRRDRTTGGRPVKRPRTTYGTGRRTGDPEPVFGPDGRAVAQPLPTLAEFRDVGGPTAHVAPSPAHTAALVAAVPTTTAGEPRRFSDFTAWLPLINPADRDGADLNCVDAALAFHATWHGDPHVAAVLANGGSEGPVGRAQEWTSYASEFLGDGADAMRDVVERVRRGGHGSAAIVFGFARADGSGHAFNVVNRGGRVFAVDAQAGTHRPADPDAMPGLGLVWAIPLDASNQFLAGAVTATAQPAQPVRSPHATAAGGLGDVGSSGSGMPNLTDGGGPSTGGPSTGGALTTGPDGGTLTTGLTTTDGGTTGTDGGTPALPLAVADHDLLTADPAAPADPVAATRFVTELAAADADRTTATNAAHAAAVDGATARQAADQAEAAHRAAQRHAVIAAAAVAPAQALVTGTQLAAQDAAAHATRLATARAEADTHVGDLRRQRAEANQAVTDLTAPALHARTTATRARTLVDGMAADDAARPDADREATRLENRATDLENDLDREQTARDRLDREIPLAVVEQTAARTAARDAATASAQAARVHAAAQTAHTAIVAASAAAAGAVTTAAHQLGIARGAVTAGAADVAAAIAAAAAATAAVGRLANPAAGITEQAGVVTAARDAARALGAAARARHEANRVQARAAAVHGTLTGLRDTRDDTAAAVTAAEDAARLAAVNGQPAPATDIAGLRATALTALNAWAAADARRRALDARHTLLDAAATTAETLAGQRVAAVATAAAAVTPHATAATTRAAQTPPHAATARAARDAARTAAETAKTESALGERARATTLLDWTTGPMSRRVGVEGAIPEAALRDAVTAAALAQTGPLTHQQRTALNRSIADLFGPHARLGPRLLRRDWPEFVGAGIPITLPNPDRDRGPLAFVARGALSQDADAVTTTTAPAAAGSTGTGSQVRGAMTEHGVTDAASTSLPVRIPLFLAVLPFAEALGGLLFARPSVFVGFTAKRSHSTSGASSVLTADGTGELRGVPGWLTVTVEPDQRATPARTWRSWFPKRAHQVVPTAPTTRTESTTLAAPPVTSHLATSAAVPLPVAGRDTVDVDGVAPTGGLAYGVAALGQPVGAPSPTLMTEATALLSRPDVLTLDDPPPAAGAAPAPRNPRVTGTVGGRAVTVTPRAGATVRLFGSTDGPTAPTADARTAHSSTDSDSRGGDAIAGAGVVVGMEIPQTYLHAGGSLDVSSGHGGGLSVTHEAAIERSRTRTDIAYVVSRPVRVTDAAGNTVDGTAEGLVWLQADEARRLGYPLPPGVSPRTPAAATPRYRFGVDDITSVPGADAIADRVVHGTATAPNPLGIDAIGAAELRDRFSAANVATTLFDAAHGGDSVTWDVPVTRRWFDPRRWRNAGLTRTYTLAWYAELRHRGNDADTAGTSAVADQVAVGRKRNADQSRGAKGGFNVESRRTGVEAPGTSPGHRSNALPIAQASYGYTWGSSSSSGGTGRDSRSTEADGAQRAFDADVHLVFTLTEVTRPTALRNAAFHIGRDASGRWGARRARPVADRRVGPSSADAAAALDALATPGAPAAPARPRVLAFTADSAVSMSAAADKLRWATDPAHATPADGGLTVGPNPRRPVPAADRVDLGEFSAFGSVAHVRVTPAMTDALHVALAKKVTRGMQWPMRRLPRYARLWTSWGELSITEADGGRVRVQPSRLTQDGTKSGDEVRAFYSQAGARGAASLHLGGETAPVPGLFESGVTTDLTGDVRVDATYHNPSVVDVRPNGKLTRRQDGENPLGTGRSREHGFGVGGMLDWIIRTGSDTLPRLRVPLGWSGKRGGKTAAETTPGSIQIATYEGPTVWLALDVQYAYRGTLTVKNSLLPKWMHARHTTAPLGVHVDQQQGVLVELPAQAAADIWTSRGLPAPPEITAVIAENPLPAAPVGDNQTVAGGAYRAFGPSSIVASSLTATTPGADPLAGVGAAIDGLGVDGEWKRSAIDGLTELLTSPRGHVHLRDALSGGRRLQFPNNDPFFADVLEITVEPAPAGTVTPASTPPRATPITPKSLTVVAFTAISRAAERFRGNSVKTGLVGEVLHFNPPPAEPKPDPNSPTHPGGRAVFGLGGLRTDQVLFQRDRTTITSLARKVVRALTIKDPVMTGHDVSYRITVRRHRDPMPFTDGATLTLLRDSRTGPAQSALDATFRHTAGAVSDRAQAWHADRVARRAPAPVIVHGHVDVVAPTATAAARPAAPAVAPTFQVPAAPAAGAALARPGNQTLDPGTAWQPETLGSRTQQALRNAVYAVLSRRPLPAAGTPQTAATIQALADRRSSLTQPGVPAEQLAFEVTQGTALQDGLWDMLTGDDYGVDGVPRKRVVHDDTYDLTITAGLRGGSLRTALRRHAPSFATDTMSFGRESENAETDADATDTADRSHNRNAQPGAVAVGTVDGDKDTVAGAPVLIGVGETNPGVGATDGVKDTRLGVVVAKESVEGRSYLFDADVDFRVEATLKASNTISDALHGGHAPRRLDVSTTGDVTLRVWEAAALRHGLITIDDALTAAGTADPANIQRVATPDGTYLGRPGVARTTPDTADPGRTPARGRVLHVGAGVPRAEVEAWLATVPAEIRPVTVVVDPANGWTQADVTLGLLGTTPRPAAAPRVGGVPPTLADDRAARAAARETAAADRARLRTIREADETALETERATRPLIPHGGGSGGSSAAAGSSSGAPVLAGFSVSGPTGFDVAGRRAAPRRTGDDGAVETEHGADRGAARAVPPPRGGYGRGGRAVSTVPALPNPEQPAVVDTVVEPAVEIAVDEPVVREAAPRRSPYGSGARGAFAAPVAPTVPAVPTAPLAPPVPVTPTEAPAVESGPTGHGWLGDPPPYAALADDLARDLAVLDLPPPDAPPPAGPIATGDTAGTVALVGHTARLLGLAVVRRQEVDVRAVWSLVSAHESPRAVLAAALLALARDEELRPYLQHAIGMRTFPHLASEVGLDLSALIKAIVVG